MILGPDGAGKSSVIQGVIAKLNQLGAVVEMRHLKPRLAFPRRGDQVTIVVDPHGQPARSALTSTAKICVWLLEEWYANLFQDSGSTLLICDRYFHDLLVDPKRYRYGGSSWVAGLIGRLMPQPQLWVLLNAPPEVLRARKQEVAVEETERQCREYLSFVSRQRNHAVVDAAQALDKVIADVVDLIQTAANKSKSRRR